MEVSDLFGSAGYYFFAASSLGEVYRLRFDSLAEPSETFRTGIARVCLVDSMLVDGAGYRAIQPILGVGPLLAATFVAEIGDIFRFTSAAQVCCKLTGEQRPHVTLR